MTFGINQPLPKFQAFESELEAEHCIPCPFCQEQLDTTFAITFHIENGGCPKAHALVRNAVLQIVHRINMHGAVKAKPPKSANSCQSTKYSSTDHAFNGSYWICYFCLRHFNSKNELDEHLNSSVHEAKIHFCPNKYDKCNRYFLTLRGLFIHLENGSCDYVRFGAQDLTDDFVMVS